MPLAETRTAHDEDTRMDDAPRSRRGALVVLALVVVLAGSGAYLVRLGFQQRDEAAAFAERAVRTRARVLFAEETRVGRNPPYTRARGAFTVPGGRIGPTFADVVDCPEARIEPDAEFAVVLYDPADETDVRPAGCLHKGSNLSLFVGALSLLVALASAVAGVTSRRARRAAGA